MNKNQLPDLPNQGDFHFPTLQALQKLGGEATVSEIEQEVIAALDITEELLAIRYSTTRRSKIRTADRPKIRTAGKSIIRTKLSWARTNLKKIETLENSQRGVWALTEKGVEYLKISESEAAELLNGEIRAYWDYLGFEEILREGLPVCGYSMGMFSSTKLNYEMKRKSAANPELSAEAIRQAADAYWEEKSKIISNWPMVAYVPSDMVRYHQEIGKAESADDLLDVNFPLDR